MSYPNDYVMQKIAITPEERESAKKIARSKGMTLQGYLAHLIKREIQEEGLNGNSNKAGL